MARSAYAVYVGLRVFDVAFLATFGSTTAVTSLKRMEEAAWPRGTA
jgi:hypothetical protein